MQSPTKERVEKPDEKPSEAKTTDRRCQAFLCGGTASTVRSLTFGTYTIHLSLRALSFAASQARALKSVGAERHVLGLKPRPTLWLRIDCMEAGLGLGHYADFATDIEVKVGHCAIDHLRA